ncbi:MAG: ABC transporter permease [Burkholderiales bacterium]|nr:ABC transporter permease [Burkholderiales bacterium]
MKAGSQQFGLSGMQAARVAIFLCVLLTAWQLLSNHFAIPVYLLPAPIDIGKSLVADYPIYFKHTLATLLEIAIGFSTGVTTGVLLAIAMSRSEAIANALHVPILATQAMPTIAIAPILIIWFGVGLAPKVIVITIFSFFPVLVNTLTGLQATGDQMIKLMRSVAATDWQIYRHIRIPMALPHFFAGVRLAAAASVIGAVVVEWVSSDKGLGYLLILHESRLNTDKAFATLVILIALSITIFALTAVAERRLSWTKRLGLN